MDLAAVVHDKCHSHLISGQSLGQHMEATSSVVLQFIDQVLDTQNVSRWASALIILILLARQCYRLSSGDFSVFSFYGIFVGLFRSTERSPGMNHEVLHCGLDLNFRRNSQEEPNDRWNSVYLLLGPLSMAFQTVAKSQIFRWFCGAPEKNGKNILILPKNWETTKKMEKPPNLPSGNLLQFAIEHGPVEIVDLPSSKIVVFHRFFVCLPWLVSNFWPSPMGCKLWGNAQAAQAQRFHPLDLGIPRYCHGSWEMLAVSHIIYIYIILHVIYIYIYYMLYIYLYLLFM